MVIHDLSQVTAPLRGLIFLCAKLGMGEEAQTNVIRDSHLPLNTLDVWWLDHLRPLASFHCIFCLLVYIQESSWVVILHISFMEALMASPKIPSLMLVFCKNK